MIPVIAASSTPPSHPGAAAKANDPNGAAGKLDASSTQTSSGQADFSAVLKMLFAGTLPSAPGSAIVGNIGTIPEQGEAAPLPKVPSANRPNAKTKTGAASALNPEAAITANVLPALPLDTQTTAETSSATTGTAAATPLATPQQFSRIGTDANRQESEATIPATEPRAAPIADLPPSKLHSVEGAAPSMVRTLASSEPKERLDSVSAPAPATQGAVKPGPPLARSETPAALPESREQTVPSALESIPPQVEPAAAGSEREAPAATKVSVTPSEASAHAAQAAPTEQTVAQAPVKPTPVLPVADQIHEQVTSHLDQLRQTGRVEMQLELHPPELGRVQLHLTLEDGHLNVRMTVQDDNAKRLIDQQAEPLRVRFAEMGVSVGQFDVRRDGSSPNPEQQPAAEPSAQTLQADKTGTGRLQKSYAKVAKSDALVDVIA